MDIESIKATFNLIGQALGLVKQATDMMPKGAQREATEMKIIEAEQAFSLAETKAAQELGYELCRCTWPPQICLRVDGRDNICLKCGHNAFHRLPQDEDGV
jgi:hypothetical protein